MNRSAAHDSLVRACVTLLRLHGFLAYPLNQVARRRADGTYRNSGAPDGFPDIIAVDSPFGTLIGVECKTGKSKPRESQRKVAAELARAGAVVLTVRSVDQLERWIKDGTLPDGTATLA